LSERFFAHDKDYSLSGKLGQQKKSNKACLLTKKIYVMGEQLPVVFVRHMFLL